MNILDRILGRHDQKQPAIQSSIRPIPGQAQVPYSQDTANRYNAHPEQFVGANAIDPKYFGYPADNSGAMQLQAQPATQGNPFNPGLSFNPQQQSYPGQQLYRTQIGQVPAYNPQVHMNGAYLTGGGVPMDNGHMWEDANGQGLFRQELSNPYLRVR